MGMHGQESTPLWRSTGVIALLFVTMVVGFPLFTEFRPQILGVLPYLFFVSCPLMHRFIHHGHHHGQAVAIQKPMAIGDTHRP